jgi:selenocysteine-specific elongation factor
MRRLDLNGRDAHGIDAQAAALTVALGEAGLQGVFPSTLQTRWGIGASSAGAVLSRLIERGEAVAVGEGVVSAVAVAKAEAVIVALLERHHRDEPLSSGLPREEVRTRVCGPAPPSVFEYVLSRLTKAERIVDRDRVAIASHRVALTGRDAEAMTRIIACYLEAGLRPPDRAALESVASVAPAVAERVIQLLLRQRVLVKVDVLYFHVESLEALKRDVRALKVTGSGSVDVARFKERYGITRKFAIPLLEYLDRERVTRRVGEKRIVI